MGCATENVSNVHAYIHPLTCCILNLLRTANPLIAWFSYYQIFLLWIACAITAGSIAVILYQGQKSVLFSLLCSAAFLWLFNLFSSAQVTYTQTTAMLGMAAVFRLFSMQNKQHSIIRGGLVSGILIILSFGFRTVASLPSVIFYFFILLYQLTIYTSNKNCILVLFSAIVCVLLSLTLWQQFMPKSPQDQKYMDWNEKRTIVTDYTDLQSVPESTFDELGWSSSTSELFKNCFYLDEDINAESLELLIEKQVDRTTTLKTRLSTGIRYALCIWL